MMKSKPTNAIKTYVIILFSIFALTTISTFAQEPASEPKVKGPRKEFKQERNDNQAMLNVMEKLIEESCESFKSFEACFDEVKFTYAAL